ncbi:MAG: hypothetical protein ABFD82_23590 [Syntrophaceae bacterium]
MRIGMVEPDWAYIGAVLARGSDDEQATFFKSFLKECSTWGTHHQIEMQLAGVNEKLTNDEKDLLGMLSFKEPT